MQPAGGTRSCGRSSRGVHEHLPVGLDRPQRGQERSPRPERLAFTSSRKLSSTIGRPCASTSSMPRPARNMPTTCVAARIPQSSSAIAFPSARNHAQVGDVGAVDRAALEELRPAEGGVGSADAHEAAREVEQRPLFGAEPPVEPRQLVVLAVRVVVAALRAADLVAGQQHRRALRQEERREQVALLAPSQRVHGRVVRRRPRPRSSTNARRRGRRGCPRRSPRCACGRMLTRSRSVKPSWAVTKLTLADGRRPLAS